MQTLDPALAAHLDGAVTTLCHCWKLIPRTLPPLGFTDHDRDLEFGGLVFAAASGLTGEEATSALGLGVDGGGVAGALSAQGLSEQGLAGGRFDDATVEAWLVNWQETSQRLLLSVGTIGEVQRGEYAFRAELRGLEHWLDQDAGRVFQALCPAQVGDARCKAALAAPAFAWEGTIASVPERGRFLALSAAHAHGWFSYGRISILSGAQAGFVTRIRDHARAGEEASFLLWSEPAGDLEPGDRFRAEAGCDKSFATCRDKFANGVNFRGFPHMPGNDYAMGYVGAGDLDLDGGLAR